MTEQPAPTTPGKDFAAQAEQKSPGIVGELWAFMRENKKWWVTPIVLSLLAIGVLLVLSTTAAGPFIYALF